MNERNPFMQGHHVPHQAPAYGPPANVWLPEPVNVSRPAAPQPPPGSVGNTGEVYGGQVRAIWTPGQHDGRKVLNLLKAEYVWRISVFGRVLLELQYGTLGTRTIPNLRTPLVMTVPGQVTIFAQPLDDEGTVCSVTATKASAGARAICRQLVGADAGAVDLHEDGADFFALVASSLTISGVVTAVPACTVVPLVAGSSLTSGGGFVEYEA